MIKTDSQSGYRFCVKYNGCPSALFLVVAFVQSFDNLHCDIKGTVCVQYVVAYLCQDKVVALCLVVFENVVVDRVAQFFVSCHVFAFKLHVEFVTQFYKLLLFLDYLVTLFNELFLCCKQLGIASVFKVCNFFLQFLALAVECSAYSCLLADHLLVYVKCKLVTVHDCIEVYVYNLQSFDRVDVYGAILVCVIDFCFTAALGEHYDAHCCKDCQE